MDQSREIKPGYRRCCVYDLEAEQISQNLQLQEIKSYGDSVTLEDGTVLRRKGQDPDVYTETNERTLCRCRKCGALFLKSYHYESDMYDSWSSESLYPVASEEEADLINILMDGKEAGVPDFRRIDRSGWSYKWIGEEEPRPLDPEELKAMIRRKYAAVKSELLEDLLRKAGTEQMVEKTSLPEPEQEEEEEEEKDYRYMINRDDEPPTLIRLGSFAKMEADMFVYPGVWKDTQHLNDLRVGLGSYMDYDDISEKEAIGIMEKLREHYDRIGNESTNNRSLYKWME